MVGVYRQPPTQHRLRRTRATREGGFLSSPDSGAVSITVPVASLVLTPYAPPLTETIDVPVGSFVLTPYAPALTEKIDIPTVSWVLTPYAPSLPDILRPNVQLSATVKGRASQSATVDNHV